MTVACFIRRAGTEFPCGDLGFVFKVFPMGDGVSAGGWAVRKGQILSAIRAKQGRLQRIAASPIGGQVLNRDPCNSTVRLSQSGLN